MNNKRSLAVCCDGTWNTADQKDHGVPIPTNVVRIYNAIEENADQIKYYHHGVGTDKNLLDKVFGGSFGLGINQNIMGAYKWLGENYQKGDQIFLFGFSRGAFTVRSLASMIVKCGLLDLPNTIDDSEKWNRVETAFKEGYREDKDKENIWPSPWPSHKNEKDSDVGVFFIGVWDTVGAFGIPHDLAILSLLDNAKEYAFHDTKLSNKVEHARHAVAIDEMRASFSPTLWANATTHTDAKEVWFPGVHCDVGGGYAETGLADGALKWMMDESGKWLNFNAAIIANQIKPDPRGVLHDSVTSVFKLMRTQPRNIPSLSGLVDKMHKSVSDRQLNPPITQAPYHSHIALSKPNDSKVLTVFASQRWNETGVYLTAGEYTFKATGEWLDAHMKFSPDGTLRNDPQIGELIHKGLSLWGNVEKVYNKLTGNPSADFKGTRRGEAAPWFALVGVIANGDNPQLNGTPAPHELVPIWQGCCNAQGYKHTVAEGQEGYFYCFANDAWDFYNNNKGSIQLTVERV